MGCLERLSFPLVRNHCFCAALRCGQKCVSFVQQHKAASDLTVALELLFIDAQYEWEKIYAGRMGDDDIMAARQKMQKLRLEAERKYFPEGFEPPQKLVTLAAKETQAYMTITYDE